MDTFIFFLEIEWGTNKNAVFEGSEALPHLHVGTETVFKENNVITSGGSRFLQGGFKIHERACSMHEIFTATPLFNETTPFEGNETGQSSSFRSKNMLR